MHPVLFKLGSLEIHTYGVLVAAGFLAGITLAQYRARRAGIAAEHIGDLGVWLIVAAMVGAKLFHILFFWDDFSRSWQETGWASLRAGFVFFGGFVGATLTGILYARLKKIPLWRLADVFAPALALGHAFGRLGCFFEGCCYGKACSLPWAVHLPGHGAPVHPTQLYEVTGNFAIFVGLSLYRKHFEGEIWWLYVLSYGTLRFIIEFFRGDYATHYFGVFTVAHLTAGVLVAIALIAKNRMASTGHSR
ncbi:MAG: Prolipoprotein diacylglyceryl transferase [Verrucomicrobiae bacterium]|nr:Prolipoprotein diacylglyceryl transferase [Verrucomicrobiae bacterium]